MKNQMASSGQLRLFVILCLPFVYEPYLSNLNLGSVERHPIKAAVVFGKVLFTVALWILLSLLAFESIASLK
jgi:hypothetical protein